MTRGGKRESQRCDMFPVAPVCVYDTLEPVCLFEPKYQCGTIWVGDVSTKTYDRVELISAILVCKCLNYIIATNIYNHILSFPLTYPAVL